MSITPISSTYNKSFRKEYHKGEKDVKAPNFYCRSCDCNNEHHCDFYNRPIDETYNRCFNHSFYHPISHQFRVPDNLEVIIQKEQEAIDRC